MLQNQSISDNMMCQARGEIDWKDNLYWKKLDAYQMNYTEKTWGGKLFTESINERTHCIEKYNASSITGSTYPEIFNPCGLMWIPTKNRILIHPCVKPLNGNLDYIEAPCKPSLNDFFKIKETKYC